MAKKLTKEMKQNSASANDGVQEAKCPNCGAPLVFDVKSKTLSCSHCGTSVDTGDWEDHEISGFDFEDVQSHAFQENAEDIPIYTCVSCGAEILAAKEEVSLTCPYCSNNIVLTDKVSGKLRPNAVIPFKITPDKLPETLEKFYKDKVLLPKNFFSEKSIGKVTGVYVPFWSFTGEVTGNVSYHAQTRDYHNSETEEVTVIKEYKLLRYADVSFKDLLLDASEKMEDAYMDSIMPYNMSEAEDFNMAYLAGFAADRFDVKSENLSARAEQLMRTSAYMAVEKQAAVGYFIVNRTGGSLKAAISQVRYLLLPVYVFDIKYQGRTFHYAMNGQTGKVVGDVPTSKKVCKTYRGVRAAAVFAVIMLLSIITYFLGV